MSTDRDTGGERIVSPEVEVRWARIKTLFTVALEKDPADRAGFLAEACGGDAALRGEIESLLAASDGVGTFLDAGANSPGGLPPLGPGTRLGPYEIVSVLGAGGMGEVYRGRDTRLGREIAIKILAVARPGEDVLRRFELEARAASALDHPNILAVHDVGTHEGRPFIVSELLRGRTLREELEGHRLPLRTALDLAVQMARGLSAAHQQGIVHRDLKPENLFVTEDGRLKILDFGIAKLLPSGPSTSTVAAPRTQAGMVLGTIGYMSPEQIRGGEIDARSDIFSFGVILYEMVFGARAFGGASTIDGAYAILYHEPPLPPSLPAGLERIVRSCLEKDRSRRPQKAADLVRDLSEAAALGEEARASARRRRRWRRGIVAGSVCVLGVLTVGTVMELRTSPTGSRSSAAAKPSIAVLAFADMSPGKDQEYFSDGIAEEILNALAQVDGLRVIGCTSSFSFKGKSSDLRSIGRALEVGNILEGSVRTAGDRVRITAQLINAADGAHLWSRTYERNMSNLFAVQDEIAASVVEALRIHLIEGRARPIVRRAANVEAYDQYVLGNHFLSRYSSDSIKRAIGAYEKAVVLDTDYAPAWAAMSRALVAAINIGTSDFDESVARRAMVAAENAIARDPGLSDGYAARGLVRQRLWDWEAARADFARALALNPADAEAELGMSVLQFELGNLREAIASDRRIVARDPLSATAWNGLGVDYAYDDQFELARAAYDRAIEIAPEHEFAFGNRVFLQIRNGEAAAALESMRKRERPFAGQTCAIAIAQHTLRHEKESQAALDVMLADEKSYSPYQIAAVYAWRGDADSAFRWLDRAYARRLRQIHAIKTDPYFRSLHGDPRFAALLQKLNLPAD